MHDSHSELREWFVIDLNHPLLDYLNSPLNCLPGEFDGFHFPSANFISAQKILRGCVPFVNISNSN